MLKPRLYIARAAQKDSRRWWEDESLTPSGAFALELRLPAAPIEAGRKLALAAARARHQNAFADDPDAIHLFRLDRTGPVAQTSPTSL